MPEMLRFFVCAKCFNAKGTLENRGNHKQPLYMHPVGKCLPMNYQVRNEIMARRYPHLFWLPLLCLGLDFNHEEVYKW